MHTINRRKRVQAGFYEHNGSKLFVATERMWAWHEGTKPKAVLERASLQWRLWYQWQERYGKEHWLFDWLYRRAEPPRATKIVYPSDYRNLRRSAREGEFFLTAEHVQFRKAAALRTVAAAVGGTGTAALHWARKYKSLPWFRDWLLAGREAPNDVRVASLAEIQRCRQAWNIFEIIASTKVQQTLYPRWFELFPEADRDQFVFWLFGGPRPSGWFFVNEALGALREAYRPTQVRKRANVSRTALDHWKANPIANQAFADAVARKGEEPSNSPAWQKLLDVTEIRDPIERARLRAAGSRSRRAMLRYAKEVTMKAALAASGMSEAAWFDHVREARKLDCEEALRLYIAGTLPGTTGRQWTKCGVLADRLFRPSLSMLRFHEEAKKRASKLRILELRSRLGSVECFAQWLLDWVEPGFARRRAAGLPPAASTNAAAPTEPTSDEPAETRSPPPSSPFIPTAFQQRLLDNLLYKSLTADGLQRVLRCDRKNLYRDGINPLRAVGMIDNNRRIGGYFRPDFPPPKYAEFLGKNSPRETVTPLLRH